MPLVSNPAGLLLTRDVSRSLELQASNLLQTRIIRREIPHRCIHLYDSSRSRRIWARPRSGLKTRCIICYRCET